VTQWEHHDTQAHTLLGLQVLWCLRQTQRSSGLLQVRVEVHTSRTLGSQREMSPINQLRFGDILCTHRYPCMEKGNQSALLALFEFWPR
jgi:hypothetical protein